jgi:hypothetical protein
VSKHCDMAHDSAAAALAKRIDALAAALRDAGVPPERSAGLLADAAAATMSAVVLEALLEPQAPPAAPVEQLPVAAPAETPVRLAA